MGGFRANVAGILQRDDGRIFVGERLKVQEAWQFPQGGVDRGEDLIAALKRELREEIGVMPDLYEIEACRTGYRYLFPKKHAKKTNWEGQEQTYFLCHFHGTDADICLESEEPEFSRFQWIPPVGFQLEWVADFKREVYQQVFRDFFALEI